MRGRGIMTILLLMVGLVSIGWADTILFQDDFDTDWTYGLSNAGDVSSDGKYTARIWGDVPNYGRGISNTSSMRPDTLIISCYDGDSPYWEDAWGVQINSLNLTFGKHYRFEIEIEPKYTGQGSPWDAIAVVNDLSLPQNDSNFRQVMYGVYSLYGRAQGRIVNSSGTTTVGASANNLWSGKEKAAFEIDDTYARFYFDTNDDGELDLVEEVAHGLSASDFPNGMYVVIQSMGNAGQQIVHASSYDNVVVTLVPEPASIALLTLSTILVGYRRRAN